MVWKLLRQHISIGQLTGFFMANLCGMVIVLLSIQFYNDVIPAFTSKDSFMKADYLILSKKVSTVGSLMGNAVTFDDEEMKEIAKQKFCKKVGAFEPAQFEVSAGLDIPGMNLSTAMFFEAVPDDFVDVQSDKWSFTPGQSEVPIIIPRDYLNLYNFGFAQSRNLPKLSEGVMGMMSMNIVITGGGKSVSMKGRIVGFSNRLNTILVPKKFMDITNQEYGNGSAKLPSRLIMEVSNPTDPALVQFIREHNYDTQEDKLDAGKTTWFLKVVVGLVMAVGLIISALAFYLLMLSIYLLLQKNTTKLLNLRLIGFGRARVAMPYQVLTVSLNLIVLVIALLIVVWIRSSYSSVLSSLLTNMAEGMSWMTWVVGILLFVIVSVLNVMAVRRKVDSIL